jgi:hypothetical protein
MGREDTVKILYVLGCSNTGTLGNQALSFIRPGSGVSTCSDWRPGQPRYRQRLVALLVIKSGLLQAVVFGGQDSIELFDENEKLVPIFFHGDERAQFVNAVAVSFIHRRNWQSLKHLTEESVCSTSNNLRKVLKTDLSAGKAAFGGERAFGRAFSEAVNLNMQGVGELFKNGA